MTHLHDPMTTPLPTRGEIAAMAPEAAARLYATVRAERAAAYALFHPHFSARGPTGGDGDRPDTDAGRAAEAAALRAAHERGEGGAHLLSLRARGEAPHAAGCSLCEGA